MAFITYVLLIGFFMGSQLRYNCLRRCYSCEIAIVFADVVLVRSFIDSDGFLMQVPPGRSWSHGLLGFCGAYDRGDARQARPLHLQPHFCPLH